MHALIIGGTRGLGQELAKALSKRYEVTVTGRTKPDRPFVGRFMPLDLAADAYLLGDIQDVVGVARPDLLVLNAGYFQDGRIDALGPADIDRMVNVGLTAPLQVVRNVMKRYDALPGLIVVTSSSQWLPREREPVYAAVKAGLGHAAKSLALDKRVGKTLHVAPSGMLTGFWAGTDKDTAGMLNPAWVAREIATQFDEQQARFRYTRIHRDPARVEEVEESNDVGK